MSKAIILHSGFKRYSILLCFLISFYNLVAQDGSLDSSFNGTGVLQPPFNGGQIKLQSDGKLILCSNGVLSRYNPDGTPDLSFGINGVDSITFGTSTILGNSTIISNLMSIQPDNKIVVFGSPNNGTGYERKYIISRRLADGQPDNSLNGSGFALLSVPYDSIYFSQIALQQDNKILLVWYTNDAMGFMITRLNSDGTGDATFGNGGIVRTPFALHSYGTHTKGIAVQNDGKIIAVGTSFTFLSNGLTADSLAIARYNTDGSLDNSFNGTGKLTYSPKGLHISNWEGAAGRSVLLQPDGKIVVGGILGYDQSHGRWFHSDAAVWRFNPDGSPDSSFNGTGLQSIDFGGRTNELVSADLQCNGKIVIGGNTGSIDFLSVNAALSRFNQNGTIDSTFGTKGILQLHKDNPNVYNGETALNSMISNYNRTYVVIGSRDAYPNTQAVFAFKQGTRIDSSDVLVTNTCYHDSTIFSITVADADSVKWDFGDGYSTSTFSPAIFTTKHLYANKGTYRVSCWVYSKCGINQVYKNILIAGPGDLYLGNDTTICEGQQITLHSNIVGQLYQWNTGSTADKIIVSQTGSYSLAVINNGCRMMDTILITLKKGPVVHLGNDTALCNGSAIKLVVAPPFTRILWNDNSTLPEKTISSGGVYSVKVELNGCTIADTIAIVEKAPPHFSLGLDTTVCNGETITLHPIVSADSLLWEDGSVSATRTIVNAGVYRLKATNGCGNFSDEIRIDYRLCETLMPTGFTPNQDGLNDEFRWKYPGIVKKFIMQIYNRSGQIVFTTNDPSKGWDGTKHGVRQPPGNYAWTMQYENANGESKNLKGTVLLIR